MKKAQVVKFWKALRDSTSVGDVVSAFVNKKGYGGKRTLERYAQADASFREGLPPEDVADKTGWRLAYVTKIGGWWEEEFSEKRQQQQLRGIALKQREKHFDDLAQTAEVLAHQTQRLLHYKDNNDVEATGNIVTRLYFRWKSSGQPVSDPFMKEFQYEEQHPVDPYLAKCLLIHSEDVFGKLPFVTWENITMGNVSQSVFDNLSLLSHSEHIKFCFTCPSCKATKEG